MTTQITTRNITSPYSVCCPWCRAPVLEVNLDYSKVSGNRLYWLRDGDTIPGLWYELTDEQKTPDGFDYELLVGDCEKCKHDYYVIEARFTNSHMDNVQDYFYGDCDFDELNMIASVTGLGQWVLQRYSTPHGAMFAHTFGPWKLRQVELVVGENGVSCCSAPPIETEDNPWFHSRQHLLMMWDSLRAFRA